MNKSISEIILERRSINEFVSDSAPPRNIIIKALEHAAFAPNHYMTQPWHFYLLGPTAINQICELNANVVGERKGEKVAEIMFKRWKKIPGWLVITSPMVLTS